LQNHYLCFTINNRICNLKPTLKMKKITTLLLLLGSFLLHAQESYPAKHPELLIGKEVKVLDITSDEYPDFFTDKELQKAYSPPPGQKIYTAKAALLGKIFKVIDVKRDKSYDIEDVTIELEGRDNLKLYYRYDQKYDFDYHFEVIGGLNLPDGFYCEYITTTNTEEGTNAKASVGVGVHVSKDVEKGKSAYYLIFNLFLPKDSKPLSSLTLILDGQKTIVKKSSLIIPEFHDGLKYKYSFTTFLTPQDLALIKVNKITGVRLGDQVAPVPNGQKMQGILNCLSK